MVEQRGPLVEVRAIEKRFGGVHALRGVDLTVQSGEIHALVGQNGAGKSTLVKVMGGAVDSDSGALVLDGQPRRFRSPANAEQAGISVVHQEVQLFPDLSVADNVTVAHSPHRRVGPLVLRDRRGARRRTREIFAQIGVDIDPRAAAGSLGRTERIFAQVARALDGSARVLVLDEPTASLRAPEAERLFALLTRLRDRGAGILFVSHKLDEVLALGDRVTVLQDGVTVARERTADLDLDRLVAIVSVGHHREAGLESDGARGAAALVARDLAADGAGPVDLDVHAGEVLALTGSRGAGHEPIARAVAGAAPHAGGDVRCHGWPLRSGDRVGAVRAGVGFIGEDRLRDGIIPELSVERNMCLGALRDVSSPLWLSRRAMRRQATEYIERLQIRPGDPRMRAGHLSGGNQQKVLLARWLLGSSRALVLEEPTHGIDVGAKGEIHVLLRRFAREGGAVLLVSGEIAELLDLPDRVGVFRHGRLVGVLPRGAGEREVAALAHGGGGTRA